MNFLKDDNGNYASRAACAEVGWRLLQSAAMLPWERFIGWQIEADRCKQIHIFAFSDIGFRLEEEDLTWIFFQYAAGNIERRSNLSDLRNENRNNYILKSIAKSGKDIVESEERKALYLLDDGYADPDLYMQELLELLSEAGGRIRVVAGSADDQESGHGMILISLPKQMTLRMRTLFSLAFPQMAAEDFGETAMDENGFPCIPDASFAGCLTRLLYGMLNYEKQNGETDREKVGNLGLNEGSEFRRSLTENSNRTAVIPFKQSSYMDQLKELVGLEEVKKQIRGISSFARLKRDMSAFGKDRLGITLNMEFTGNPGTAKTTVARIAAGIFHEIGLLLPNGLIEVGRADLVSKYEGKTAEKVRNVFQKAKGKVLFIDEAYSLVEYREGSYGDEAINTIVHEMDNHRDDMIVIFAGYPDRMEDFFDRNPGLRSRVPFKIHFRDYCSSEMLEIVELEAGKRGFIVDKKARRKLIHICEQAAEMPEAGNGRFCRNLVENAILGYASRVYGDEETVPTQNFVLTKEDFLVPSILTEERRTDPIGFQSVNKAV